MNQSILTKVHFRNRTPHSILYEHIRKHLCSCLCLYGLSQLVHWAPVLDIDGPTTDACKHLVLAQVHSARTRSDWPSSVAVDVPVRLVRLGRHGHRGRAGLEKFYGAELGER